MNQSLIRNIILAALLLCSACATQKTLTLPEAVALPATPSSEDTVSTLSFREVFHDENLRSLIEIALQHNFDLLSAQQRINIAAANLNVAKSAWLPKVEGAVSAGAEKYGDYTQNGVGNFDTNFSDNINGKQEIPYPVIPSYFIGLRSSWELDVWGKLKLQKQAVNARFLATKEGKHLIRTQVIASIAGMYYELTTLDNELQIIKSNIKLQESALATVEIQKAGGRATELAVQQFRAQLLGTKALEFKIRQDIAALEFQLNAVLGRMPQAIARTRQNAKQTVLPSIEKGISAQLLLNRPDVQQAEWELAATKVDVQVAQKAFLPSLTITPYLGFESFKAKLLFEPASIAWGAIGGLTAPIFQQKKLKANYAQREAAAYQAFYNYQQKLVNGYQEVATTLNKVENEQKAYDFKLQEVAVLQQAVATANTLFTTGYASYLEVITAQKSVLEAELSLVNTRRRVYQGIVSLYRALGGS